MDTPTKNHRNPIAKLAHRFKNDRGAVLVEAAICIPLLLLVILGAVEAGIAWEAKSSTVSGVRTGVLRASSTADESTDFRILQSIVGEIGTDNTDRIEWVMVFEAESGDPEQDFLNCRSLVGAGGSDAQNCIVYDAAFIQAVRDTTTPVDFLDDNFDPGTNGLDPDPTTGLTPDYPCEPGIEDSHWCASARTVNGNSTLGVAISYQHDWFTGILPFSEPLFEEFVISRTLSGDDTP